MTPDPLSGRGDEDCIAVQSHGTFSLGLRDIWADATSIQLPSRPSPN